MANRPFLLVRARVHPAQLTEFRRWYRTVHLPHVLGIPGIVGYRGLAFGADANDDAPNVLSVYLFADESVVQKALGSPEAQRARADWAEWAQYVRDLTIQVYAPVDARVNLRHLN
jgi:uncharacterized protein (TIGR02118 family)